MAGRLWCKGKEIKRGFKTKQNIPEESLLFSFGFINFLLSS
jgi:hypothetical protein